MRRLILAWRFWRSRALAYRWLPAWRSAGHTLTRGRIQ